MKRGLFVLATVTLSSALYAQDTLTPAQVREIFARYNPALLAQTSQNSDLKSLVDSLCASFASQYPADTLENRYNLIALARNFENSLALSAITEDYQQAVLYSQLSGNVQNSARVRAEQALTQVYGRIWAVSVQVKEQLLAAQQQARKQARREGNSPLVQQYTQAIRTQKADLKALRTDIGEQLQLLAKNSVLAAEEQARAQLQQLQAAQADNLHIKTNHKKPVAE